MPAQPRNHVLRTCQLGGSRGLGFCPKTSAAGVSQKSHLRSWPGRLSMLATKSIVALTCGQATGQNKRSTYRRNCERTFSQHIGSIFTPWGEVGGFLIGDASGRAGEAGPAPRTARWDGWTPSGRKTTQAPQGGTGDPLQCEGERVGRLLCDSKASAFRKRLYEKEVVFA